MKENGGNGGKVPGKGGELFGRKGESYMSAIFTIPKSLGEDERHRSTSRIGWGGRIMTSETVNSGSISLIILQKRAIAVCKSK
jgi:hypothetical protein